MMNKEYRTRLETLLSFFKYASSNKNVKTIKVEGTGFLNDAELIIDLIEKELKSLNEEKYVSDNNVGNKKMNKDVSSKDFFKHLGHMNKSQAIEILETRKKRNILLADRLHCVPKYQGTRTEPELENMAISIALESLKQERPKGKLWS